MLEQLFQSVVSIWMKEKKGKAGLCWQKCPSFVDIVHVEHVEYRSEYVASLMGLYKNNGAVSCVRINFHLIRSLYYARTDLPRAMGILRY